jgi:protein-ribulosamine 3-kinase
VTSTESHGVSFWANTIRLDVELADGTPKACFIKVVSKELGKNMVHGEFESMKAIHTLLLDFSPKPIERTKQSQTRTSSFVTTEI